jgi:spore coat protein U-like protein
MSGTRVLIIVAVLVGSLYASEAQAQSCTISATSVNFGTYSVFNGSSTNSTGTIQYRCNGNTNWIWITLTRGASATFNPRQMVKGAERLNYNLFRNASLSTIWGDGTGGTSLYFTFDPPNNTTVTLTVYGSVPAGQDVSAGSFSDSITAVINF